MPKTPTRTASKNRVLARLARADMALLKPHLAPVDLPVSTQLETANARIDTVYFMERGFASVVADGPGERSIEVGIIGREGMTGLALVLGHDRAAHETFMQAGGGAQRISAAHLRKAMDQSVRLHRSLLRCAHDFLIQTAQTAVANGRSKLEERLARWLLMANAHRRTGGAPHTQISRRHAWRAPTVCDAGGTGSRTERSHPCRAAGDHKLIERA
jgi:CRP-like cAMP-binding protein